MIRFNDFALSGTPFVPAREPLVGLVKWGQIPARTRADFLAREERFFAPERETVLFCVVAHAPTGAAAGAASGVLVGGRHDKGLSRGKAAQWAYWVLASEVDAEAAAALLAEKREEHARVRAASVRDWAQKVIAKYPDRSEMFASSSSAEVDAFLRAEGYGHLRAEDVQSAARAT